MRSLIYIEPTEEKIDPIVKQIAAKLRNFPVEVRGEIVGISVTPLLEKAEELGFLEQYVRLGMRFNISDTPEGVLSVFNRACRDETQNILFSVCSPSGNDHWYRHRREINRLLGNGSVKSAQSLRRLGTEGHLVAPRISARDNSTHTAHRPMGAIGPRSIQPSHQLPAVESPLGRTPHR